MKQIFTVNVSENTRVCPLVARLNPEWRCKEWDEEKTETYSFTDFKENGSSNKQYKFDLDESGESFTKITGQHNVDFVTRIELTTNFGR
jgi:hypothetical protein